MSEPFAKDVARRMRKELADLEADQAKATCWGAALGERGKRIDALRRELERQTDTPNETGTSAEAVEALAKDHDVVAEKHDELIMTHPHHSKTAAALRTLAAERDALQAKLEKAAVTLNVIDALDPEGMVNGWSQSALSGLVLRMGELARVTLAELKGGKDE